MQKAISMMTKLANMKTNSTSEEDEGQETDATVPYELSDIDNDTTDDIRTKSGRLVKKKKPTDYTDL